VKQQSMSQADFETELKENKLKVDHPVVGNIEFKPVGSSYGVKITHESGVSFLLIDSVVANESPEHVTQLRARQNFDAGKEREHRHYIDQNGNRRSISAGRDTIVITIDR